MSKVKYVLSDNPKVVEAIQKRLAINPNCPCVPSEQWNEDTICICKAFKEAPSGTTCHCGLYTKVEEV